MIRASMLRAILGVGAIAMLAVAGAGCANDTAVTCDPECPPAGYLCCGDDEPVCRNTFNDPANCGACGRTCPSGVCSSGTCMPATDGGVIPGTDSSAPVGNCRPECGLNDQCCNDSTTGAPRCISRSVASGADGRTDPSFTNCGTCGFACSADLASACSVASGATTPTCRCGDYGQCGAGQTCVSQGGTFACVSTATDINNCGAVGNMCGMGESCTAGVCQCGSTGASCAAGQACCGMACVDVQADTANCGGCGIACDAGESCQAGACVCGSGAGARECTAPAMGAPGESCCDGICLANTATNCGCGVVCEDDDTCIFSGGGLIPGAPTGGGVCCGQEIPIIGGFCSGGGLPGLGDGGLPFP